VHAELGAVSASLGDHEVADTHLRQALALFTELGDQDGVCMSRNGLAVLLSYQNRYAEALDHAVAALRLRRVLADQAATAYAENAVGYLLAHLGQPDAALWYCRRALEMHRAADSRTGLADTLDSIAFAYGQRGDFAEAGVYCEQAIAMYRLVGNPQGEATAWTHLGDVQLADGQPDAAQRSWQQALGLLVQVPGTGAGEVSERLARIPVR
jgi:tetratricopeptide (TPR) repeat protein